MGLLSNDALDRLGEGDSDAALIWRSGERSESAFAGAVRGWATELERRGVIKGDRVAVILPKGPVAIECLFGCFARGAIAVPIDHATPSERMKGILAQTTPVLVVSEGMIDTGCDSLCVDPMAQDAVAEVANLSRIMLDTDDTAMILMTSGSTGTPKGIAVSHGNLTAFSDWAIETFAIDASDRFISIAPLHFDLSVLDILTSRRIGAAVYLVSKSESLFPSALAKAIETQAITILYTVPTALQMMHDHGGLAARDLGALRWILYAGEVYPAARLRGLMQDVPGPRYANLYGPTETNVVCWDQIDRDLPRLDEPSIGKPCAHSRVIICDDEGRLVGAGEAGEICVAGPTVMQGYWGRRALTAACYFKQDDTLLRTGDIGQVDDRGRIRFLGRKDRQIKLRGYRVDLAEIENVAVAMGSVGIAVATVLESGTRFASLCLHVCPRDAAGFAIEELKSYLYEHLANASMPDRVLVQTAMPLTATGKVDHSALVALHGAANNPGVTTNDG